MIAGPRIRAEIKRTPLWIQSQFLNMFDSVSFSFPGILTALKTSTTGDVVYLFIRIYAVEEAMFLDVAISTFCVPVAVGGVSLKETTPIPQHLLTAVTNLTDPNIRYLCPWMYDTSYR